ncbi:hypothetical protein [Chondrinema litorale]|uniref:hypothetical protein n=1 Tax=Chondrinema litorale TaxID=2994555 RepID=UPI0025434AD0|nr:hypothetical protein [Chondrinema litorale]UZS00048.1 hypothetical protein OQ292_39605 [Chondrinema litorale]
MKLNLAIFTGIKAQEYIQRKMVIKLFKILFFVLLMSGSLMSQTLSIRPYYGGNYSFTRSGKGFENSPVYKCCMPIGGVNMGIMGELGLGKWDINIGYSWNSLAWGFKLQVPEIENYKGSRIESKRIIGYDSNQLAIGVNRSLGDVHRLFPIHSQSWIVRATQYLLKTRKPWEDKTSYLFQFRLKWLVGGAWNQISIGDKTKKFDNMISAQNGWVGDAGYYYHQNNISLYSGFAIQFIQKDRDRLRLDFLFNQGLKDAIKVDLNYTINDESANTSNSYYTQIYSRASFFVLRASYPIVIKRWNKEK